MDSPSKKSRSPSRNRSVSRSTNRGSLTIIEVANMEDDGVSMISNASLTPRSREACFRTVYN